MIRGNHLCKNCKQTCNDKGTDIEPIKAECPSCSGEGCERCVDGYFQVVGCPSEFVGDMWQTINLIELFRKGAMPVSGGVLDQSCNFIECEKRFRTEESLVRNEME